MNLKSSISNFLGVIQVELFPQLEEVLGPLTDKQQQLVIVLESICIEKFVLPHFGGHGCPPKNRRAMARAFVAKAIYNMPTTRSLLDQLKSNPTLRRLCGWERQNDIPSESTFSRAMNEFSETDLPTRIHEALVRDSHKARLVGHVSRDSTSIKGREKPAQKEKAKKKPKRSRGRPKAGEKAPPKEPTRLERQVKMDSIVEMVEDLPIHCDVGTKKSSKGYKETWIGYKLHIDVADGDIPLTCLLTSASLHDSQVALPLGTITNTRVTSCYDLMDAAYDIEAIKEHSRSMGHVPIIDVNPRRNKLLKEELQAESKRCRKLGIKYPEDIRYNERTGVERVNGYLKDNFGGRNVRVRGPKKVMCHLMFGILAVTATQLMRLVV